jgi:hypothetical protein
MKISYGINAKQMILNFNIAGKSYSEITNNLKDAFKTTKVSDRVIN